MKVLLYFADCHGEVYYVEESRPEPANLSEWLKKLWHTAAKKLFH